LLVETNYPWDGGVAVTVEATDEQPWTLSLRIPGWCQRYTCEFTAAVEAVTSDDGAYLQLTGPWRAGDRVLLDLEMAPRLVEAHPRIDAVRGSLAVQRGPLVYCLEPWDQPAGVDLDTVQLVAEQPLTSAWRGDLLEGVMVVEGRGLLPDEAGWRGTPCPADLYSLLCVGQSGCCRDAGVGAARLRIACSGITGAFASVIPLHCKFTAYLA
jgi:DUF1680 family protein